MNYKYAVIKPSEDGDPVCYLNNAEENDIDRVMEDYGITEWIEDYTDPSYWKEGQGMLVKIQCINPIPVTKVTKWKLPQ